MGYIRSKRKFRREKKKGMLCLVNNNNKATRVGSRPWMFGRRITGAGNRWIDRFSVFSLNAISDIEPRTHVWNLVAASTLTDSPIFFSRCSSSYFLLAIYYWSVWSDNEDKKEKKKEKRKKEPSVYCTIIFFYV